MHSAIPTYIGWNIFILYADGTVRWHYWNHHNEPVSLGVDWKRNSRVLKAIVKDVFISGVLD